MIKHENNKYVLYTKDGSKILGRHDSYESALKQERAIQMSKHASIILSPGKLIHYAHGQPGKITRSIAELFDNDPEAAKRILQELIEKGHRRPGYLKDR